jgi:hypothetical protein
LKSVPKLDPIELKILLQDLYETEYGIFDHLTHGMSRPLSSVAMFFSEDINSESLLEESMDTYVNKNVKDFFGLSYLEFMGLPYDVMLMVLERCTILSGKKKAAMDDIENSLRK